MLIKLNSSNPSATPTFTADATGSLNQAVYVQSSGTNSGAALTLSLPDAQLAVGSPKVYLYNQTASTYMSVTADTNILLRGSNATPGKTAILSGLGSYTMNPLPDGQWELL